MTNEKYREAIKRIKSLYQYLNLSFKQAEKVYHLEQQEQGFHSTEHYFTDWEIYDYRLDNFQNILDEKQFKKHVSHHNKIIKAHEASLIEMDKGMLQDIEYNTALIDFYEHHYIPDFFNEKFHLDLVPDIHKSKILFLKLEYGRFLNNEKIRLLSSHYRNSRLFMPNKLQADLLGHKLLHIIPNFYRFKYKMDEPTKTVARHLLDYFQYIPEKHKAFFEKKEKELKAFVKKIQSKYLKTFKWGVITLSETEQQAKENKTMLTVLMDKKNMVCQTNQ